MVHSNISLIIQVNEAHLSTIPGVLFVLSSSEQLYLVIIIYMVCRFIQTAIEHAEKGDFSEVRLTHTEKQLLSFNHQGIRGVFSRSSISPSYCRHPTSM